MLPDMNVVQYLQAHFFEGIPTRKSDLPWVCCPSFSVYLASFLRAVNRNTNDCQTAKAVRADQDALFDMFERLEGFFRRLDIYTEVAPDKGMVDTITEIMVQVLIFLGSATKEIKQGRISEPFLNK